MYKPAVGDYVIVRVGRYLGAHGEITNIEDPFDGAAPIATIESSVGEIGVAVDRLEKMRRPER